MSYFICYGVAFKKVQPQNGRFVDNLFTTPGDIIVTLTNIVIMWLLVEYVEWGNQQRVVNIDNVMGVIPAVVCLTTHPDEE